LEFLDFTESILCIAINKVSQAERSKMNKLMLIYLLADFLFLAAGGLILAFSLLAAQQEKETLTIDNVATNLLLTICPLTAGVVNAIIVFATFLTSLAALALPTNRTWLKLQGWLVVVCSFFTLILGLIIWFNTLQTRNNLSTIWVAQSVDVQSLLQEKFNCCGYLNFLAPAFVVDPTCPNSNVASTMAGCVSGFSSYANSYLGLVFTIAFGIVAVDVVVLLCIVMVLKHRAEQQRYKHIDEKSATF